MSIRQANAPMRRRTRTRRLVLASALIGLGAAAAVDGSDGSAALGVAVTVPPVARLRVLSQTRPLEVSAQDLERGFVDVTEPMQLSIYSNSSVGYVLEIVPLMPLVQSIEVRGLRGQVQLGAAGGRIVQRSSGAHTEALTLTFRIGLAAGVAPGVYPWPLHFSVQPEEAEL
jgi:hypothetical protein